MSFVDNLRSAMQRGGVTQSELARRLGIRSQAVNQWFRPGGTAPRGKRLLQVAAVLGVELSELLGKSDLKKHTISAHEERVALLAAFDSMHEHDRETLLRVAQSLHRGDPPTPTKSAPRERRTSGSVVTLPARRSS